MGNKPHSAVVEYEQVLQKLTPDSIDSLAGYFSLAGAVSSSESVALDPDSEEPSE